MTLDQMLAGVKTPARIPAIPVTGLQYDSRLIGSGEVFFAFPGEHADGHHFIPQAVERGAAAVVSERPLIADVSVPWIQVSHGREALGLAALNCYHHPDRRLWLTGVTGTNGKTTTVYLADSVLRAAGFTTARFGTTEYVIAGRRLAAVNTTPESLDLVRHFVELLEHGGTHAIFEVSSHALELRRVYGMQFHTVVFTNLTRDHLDFHGTMENYAAAKRRLLDGAGGPNPRFAVIHHGDPWGKKWEKLGGFETLTFGLNNGADITPTRLECDSSGVRFTASTPVGRIPISSPLLGKINVLNILAAIGVGLSYRLPLEVIARAIEECRSVPGRVERVEEGQPFMVVVDYAHTDDALRNVISAARDLVSGRTPGRVITLFGCGGDRDRAKRPLMGEAAGSLSDLVVLTSDNPRSEDPLNIINDAVIGLQRVNARYQVEPDRAVAIRKAIEEARAGDFVILAGKGHETYQVLGSKTIPFDDREVARQVLREFGYRKE
ncbi:MAG: UDP-N-acetylmuramoyl-L-alanyl-D-glutamate--2,6-diaminopimelate ligase [Acidobacteria bacterium]|nr:UDP-N-acetylmuramoyl-L-alanyl-D-glutamate--2,6-diaminopimelate ligase [Acidobacteriota bacterium]